MNSHLFFSQMKQKTPCWINIPGIRNQATKLNLLVDSNVKLKGLSSTIPSSEEWDVFCSRHHRQILSFVPWRLGLLGRFGVLGGNFWKRHHWAISLILKYITTYVLIIYVTCYIDIWYTCLYKCHLFEEKSNRHPATQKDVSWLGLCLQGMVPFGEFTAILASHFMAITARKKSRSQC